MSKMRMARMPGLTSHLISTKPTKPTLTTLRVQHYSTIPPPQSDPPPVQTPLQSKVPPQQAADPIPHQPIQTPLQTQTPPNIMAAHQSPRARSHAERPGLPRSLFWQIIGMIIVLPPAINWYWGYRKDHMDRKRAALIAQAQAQARANGRG